MDEKWWDKNKRRLAASTARSIALAAWDAAIESGCGCPVGAEMCLKYTDGNCRIKVIGEEAATEEIVRDVLGIER